jgi:polysaccharide biosynthesis transport protein
VGHTYVLQIAYTSPSPSRAAEIANAYANAYLVEQLNLGIEETRRARGWLQQRTEELRQLSVNADLAVQKFRADNNLLSTRGTLTSEQQLNEMMTQLVAARAATAQAQARYDRIKHIVDMHQTEAAVTESLSNSVISDLRTKYLDAARRLSDLERKLGPDHIAVVNLKNTMNALSSLLFQEFGRVAESYRNDYEVAAERKKALSDELTRERSIAVKANDAQVQLRQLEQKAEGYKKLYQTFLQRYQETAQQESFPLAEAHIIDTASVPFAPSHPRTALVLGISLMLGVVAGASAAALREFTDYVFRSTEQVRAELGVDVLGLLPVVSRESSDRHDRDKIAPILRYAVDNPLSAFTEALRLSKVAVDLALKDQTPKIIGLVSLLPKEGKSTIAKNFASLLAFHGASTLLIDADTRNPALTRAIGGVRGNGSESLSAPLLALPRLLRYESETGLHILPCIYDKNDPRAAEGLSSATLRTLIQSSDRPFDYIVVDLPPIGPVVGARGMAPLIGCFILVIEWGATSRGAVRTALAKERSINEKLLGVILNKVDMKKLKNYEHFGSDGYYNRHYEAYYTQNG